MTEKQHAKGLLEGLVAECVAHGVDRAVDVAQPVSQVPQGDGDAVGTEGGDQHHDVVGRPRQDEGEENGTESLCSLLLLDQHHPLPLSYLALQGRVHGFGGG